MAVNYKAFRLGAGASDAQIQTCVDAIVSELMTRQAARTLITGL